jgi:hypothetical protein
MMNNKTFINYNNEIIKLFFKQDTHTLKSFHIGLRNRFNFEAQDKVVKKAIRELLKYKIILLQNKNDYILTDEGVTILMDNKYYYERKIYDFIVKHEKVLNLKKKKICDDNKKLSEIENLKLENKKYKKEMKAMKLKMKEYEKLIEKKNRQLQALINDTD